MNELIPYEELNGEETIYIAHHRTEDDTNGYEVLFNPSKNVFFTQLPKTHGGAVIVNSNYQTLLDKALEIAGKSAWLSKRTEPFLIITLRSNGIMGKGDYSVRKANLHLSHGMLYDVHARECVGKLGGNFNRTNHISIIVKHTPEGMTRAKMLVTLSEYLKALYYEFKGSNAASNDNLRKMYYELKAYFDTWKERMEEEQKEADKEVAEAFRKEFVKEGDDTDG